MREDRRCITKVRMQTAIITLRVPTLVKRRIQATARKAEKSAHKWAVDTLTRAANGEEDDANWAEHFEWLRKHGRKGSGLGDEVIRARR